MPCQHWLSSLRSRAKIEPQNQVKQDANPSQYVLSYLMFPFLLSSQGLCWHPALKTLPFIQGAACVHDKHSCFVTQPVILLTLFWATTRERLPPHCLLSRSPRGSYPPPPAASPPNPFCFPLHVKLNGFPDLPPQSMGLSLVHSCTTSESSQDSLCSLLVLCVVPNQSPNRNFSRNEKGPS